jgi:hypothetical protein
VHCNGRLPVSIQFVYSLQIIVPDLEALLANANQGFGSARSENLYPLPWRSSQRNVEI